MFNVLSVETGDKVDFWSLTDDPFDTSRIARRKTLELFGRAIAVSSPEDTILAKLCCSRLSGGSEKQVRDALRVYEMQYARLDLEYLLTWAGRLEVTEELATIRDRAEPLSGE